MTRSLEQPPEQPAPSEPGRDLLGESLRGNAVLLANLLDAVLLVASDLSLPVVLQRIVEAACKLTGARYGALGVLDEDGSALSQFITAGIDEPTRAAIGELPSGRGLLGYLITTAAPLRLADLHRHPSSVGFPAHHPEMKTFLGVPIRVQDHPYGDIYLTEKASGELFTPEDEQVVVALAAAAGAFIENARLHDKVRELTLYEERERMARDLHDTVIQRIFAIGLSLQGLLPLIEAPEVTAPLTRAIEEIDETIRDVRATIFSLDTSAVGSAQDSSSIRSAVLNLVAEMVEPLDIEPEVVFKGPIEQRVRDELKRELIPTIREALANVARHAKATRIRVSIDSSGSELVLKVTDNGIGFDPHISHGGHGLQNIAGRALSLGGGLHIAPEPGGGTSLTWQVPLR